MRIGEIRSKIFLETGFDIPPERLRRYEKNKLLPMAKRIGKGRFRDYTPEQYDKIKKIVLTIEMGVPLKELGNPEVIQKRVEEVLKVASQLRKQ